MGALIDQVAYGLTEETIPLVEFTNFRPVRSDKARKKRKKQRRRK
jgi:hypothetical protein